MTTRTEPTPQHTPTPWLRTRRHHAFGVSRGETVIGSPSHGAVADTGGCSVSVAMDDANAEFIVRAVNSHAALVEALEGLISTAETRDRQAIEDALIHGRAALAAAKVTK